MAIQWISGSLKTRKVWSDGLFTLTIHCPGVTPFEPGQFLQLGLPLPEKHLHRPYSVASPHGQDLDFFIVRVEGGELTPRLWDLQIGQSIDVSTKATGGFTLSHTPPANNLWLLATGTGLAPYIAMLRDKHIWDTYERIILVHGVRFLTDLAYTDELDQHQEAHAGRLIFIPVVSRALAVHGFQGRITQAIECGKLEELAGIKLCSDNSAVMMCGNPQMLDDVEEILNARGMRKHKRSEPGHYVVERYW
jgi:ferredoxin--NADP+ reductase